MKSQFFLVENPITQDTDDQFIYHSKNPRFFAKIIALEQDIEIATMQHVGENITFFYINPDSIKECYTLVVTDNIDNATEDQLQSKLKRMTDWWYNYLIWEDKQNVGVAGQKSLLADWNENTPGLKILYSDFAGKWMIIYKGIVKTFENEFMMDDFLINKMDVKESNLKEGYLNQL